MEGTKPNRFRALAQLMRLPLVIVAISNAQAAYLLREFSGLGDEWAVGGAVSLALMSFGLYCFGAISNDIVDHRRDQFLNPTRPLPSGAISMQFAHLLAAGMLMVGLGAGLAYASAFGGGLMSAFFLAWAVMLTFFYNLTGKFVGAVGMLTLGLIGFFHAAVGQPSLAVIWHPLLILNHVVLLASVVYMLEGRRPRFTRLHQWSVLAILLALDLLFVAGLVLVSAWRAGSFENTFDRLGFASPLMYAAIAAAVFAGFTLALLLSLRSAPRGSARQQVETRRRTGRRLAVFGLLWLILYDIAFVYGYLREL